MTPTDPNRCAICPRTAAQHNDPDCHHLFSPEGQLIPKPVKRAARTPGTMLTAESAMTARLAVLLSEKNIINEVDLVYILTGVKNAPANAESPDGRDSSGDS